MGKFLLNVPDHKLDELRRLSAITGIPVATYIRQGIDVVINSQVPCSLMISGSVISGYAILVGGK